MHTPPNPVYSRVALRIRQTEANRRELRDNPTAEWEAHAALFNASLVELRNIRDLIDETPSKERDWQLDIANPLVEPPIGVRVTQHPTITLLENVQFFLAKKQSVSDHALRKIEDLTSDLRVQFIAEMKTKLDTPRLFNERKLWDDKLSGRAAISSSLKAPNNSTPEYVIEKHAKGAGLFPDEREMTSILMLLGIDKEMSSPEVVKHIEDAVRIAGKNADGKIVGLRKFYEGAADDFARHVLAPLLTSSSAWHLACKQLGPEFNERFADCRADIIKGVSTLPEVERVAVTRAVDTVDATIAKPRDHDRRRDVWLTRGLRLLEKGPSIAIAFAASGLEGLVNLPPGTGAGLYKIGDTLIGGYLDGIFSQKVEDLFSRMSHQRLEAHESHEILENERALMRSKFPVPSIQGDYQVLSPQGKQAAEVLQLSVDLSENRQIQVKFHEMLESIPDGDRLAFADALSLERGFEFPKRFDVGLPIHGDPRVVGVGTRLTYGLLLAQQSDVVGGIPQKLAHGDARLQRGLIAIEEARKSSFQDPTDLDDPNDALLAAVGYLVNRHGKLIVPSNLVVGRLLVASEPLVKADDGKFYYRHSVSNPAQNAKDYQRLLTVKFGLSMGDRINGVNRTQGQPSPLIRVGDGAMARTHEILSQFPKDTDIDR